MGKRNLILILILLIVIVLIFISVKKQKKENYITHNYILKKIKFDEITKMKIKNFTLKNIKGTWKIDNVTCNKHEIEYLVNLLKSIDFNNVISTNKNLFKKFQVTDNSSIFVEIFLKNGEKYRIYIGKETPDGNGCYVRYNDKVYLVTQNLRLDFDKTKKDFYLIKKKKTSKKKK